MKSNSPQHMHIRLTMQETENKIFKKRLKRCYTNDIHCHLSVIPTKGKMDGTKLLKFQIYGNGKYIW